MKVALVSWSVSTHLELEFLYFTFYRILLCRDTFELAGELTALEVCDIMQILRVLQCAVVCCTVLQCVAVRCSVH